MSLLWSYFYARRLDLDEFLGGLQVPRLRFFADSGAHSARTLGGHIDLDEYAGWIKRWSPWFTIYANLDVIWAARQTWDNQRRLEEVHGLHPMPVFHTGESWAALERYLDAGYTYIALGKLLGNSVKSLRPWLDRCFRMAEGRAVFHGFGLTVWQLLREFPFYSVDSSSWGSGVRYGALKLFHQGRWVNVRLGDRASVTKHREALEAYGVPVRAMTRGGYDRDVVAGACAIAQYRAAQVIRGIHGPIQLPAGKGYPPLEAPRHPRVVPASGNQGLDMYLAEASTAGHVRHAGGLHLYLADSSLRWTKVAARSHARETA
jgi:hypothetical protein